MYIGNTPTTQSFVSGTDYFSGTGSTTAFTLSRSVASINDIEVYVNNVAQQPNTVYTVLGTTLTFTTAPSSGTNNIYVRYLSTTTQTVTPSQNSVTYPTLDTNNQSKLGITYKNRIINGAMVIDQRNAGASVTNSAAIGIYTLDRYAIYGTFASKFTCQQNAGSVTPPVGFSNYMGFTSLSNNSPAATDEYIFYQKIEGFNTSDLGWGTVNAKTITISAWVYSSLTGTFSGAVQNSAANRFYPFSYTISSANTWTQISVTIAGDTSGTWVGATNGIGIYVKFNLGTGSTYLGTAGAWTTSFANGVTGSVNVLGTSGATFKITGVQLEVGSQATTFTTAGGSYGAEFALCQRYYEVCDMPYIYMGGASYSDLYWTIPFKVTKRSAPACGGLTGLLYYTGGSSASFSPSLIGSVNQMLLSSTGLTTATGFPQQNAALYANAEL